MIPFKYRFHGHGSLAYLHKKGEIIRSKNFSIKFIRNKIKKNSRIAVIVSKKIAKHAVKRNRIRRRVYEVIRLNLPKFENVYDVAIIINNIDVETMPYEELSTKIENTLREAQIIK